MKGSLKGRKTGSSVTSEMLSVIPGEGPSPDAIFFLVCLCWTPCSR